MAADVRTSHAICRRPYATANGSQRSHEGMACGIRVVACAAGKPRHHSIQAIESIEVPRQLLLAHPAPVVIGASLRRFSPWA